MKNPINTFGPFVFVTALFTLIFPMLQCNVVQVIYDKATLETTPNLCDLDKSKMIPLRDATYRKYHYTAKLTGSAIKGDQPFELHYDTGSWTTSIPYGAVDKSKIKVLVKGIKDSWGKPADKVSGQLSVRSVDGTIYTIDNYVFYATKNEDGSDLPDDRTNQWGNGSIMGALTGVEPWSNLPSFPHALAEKYSKRKGLGLGMGIVSDCHDDIVRDWPSFKSYLQLGADPKITAHLKWRTDIPLWWPELDFCPEAVPGFKVKIHFPGTGKSMETADDLMATIDTGAPELTLRLGPNDPQNQSPFAAHFVKDGPWKNWRNAGYDASATTLINATVTVEFTDSKGEKNAYSYPVGDNPYASPNALFAGDWNGDVPWPANNRDKPRNRINLGNTIYFYCPVYFYDIQNKRIGIAFR